MKCWQLLFGLFLATIPDVSSGVLATHLIFGYEPIWMNETLSAFLRQLCSYVAGAMLGMLPDFDHLLAKKPRNIEQLSGEHRSISHHPLITIPVALLILWVLFSEKWALVGGLAMFAHYIDDTFDKSGVQWFYPLWPNHIEFFRPDIINIRTPEDVKKNPPPELQEWLEENFLQISRKSVINTVYTLCAAILVLKGG